MHADLVGKSGLRLDRFGVDVLKELKATVTVWRLEHRDVGVIAIKADGSVGPVTTDRVTADDREAEVGEKGDRCFEVANGDADVLEFDGHALHATEPGGSGTGGKDAAVYLDTVEVDRDLSTGVRSASARW
ncbi:hypothetical protein GCM10010340_49850 [Streptomyces griseoloalbus]|nr:hypothetical protein GCM10010340_49850 [Streptomyces albaduncus]